MDVQFTLSGGRLFWRAALVLLVPFTSQLVQAADPSVAFDFGRTAECRDISAESATELFADEKIVELRFRISVHLLSGDLDKLQEVRVEIGDCDSKIRGS